MNNIQDIMSKPAVTCKESDTLNEAARLMWEFDVGAIPVTNKEGGLSGIITDRDICMATYTRGSAPHSIRVNDAMAKQVFSCHIHDSLPFVEQLMSDKQIRRIPVIDDLGRPLGLVSLNDIARHVASAKKRDRLEHELTETMAAICRPRPASMHLHPGTQARSV